MQTPVIQSPLPERERRWYPRRVIVATLMVVLVATAFYLLYLFSNVLFVLFVAAVLATALRPAVLWLERFHIPQRLGVLLLYFVTALATIAIVGLLVPQLVAQGSTLVTRIPEYYGEVREQLRSLGIPIVDQFVNQLPAQAPMNATPAPQPGTNVEFVGQAIGYVRAATWSLFGAFAIALITFFWIVDREQIVRAGLLAVPVDFRDQAHDIYDTLEEKVGAFIRGQALLCLSIGALSAIGFFAIGLPNALLLSVLAGILEAIPYVGPIVTALAAVILTLAESPDKIWWVIGVCIVIQQIENAVLVPRIMDQTVGVNAVVTLLAIAAFGTLMGIGGAIMAIPLAVIVQVLVDRLLLNTSDTPTSEIEGRDQLAVLRYQAQDLAQDLRDRIRDNESETEEELIEEALEAVVGDVDQLLVNLRTPATATGDAQPAA